MENQDEELIKPFQGLTVSDLEPLHHIQQTVHGRTINSKVVVDRHLFPLEPCSIIFNVGTLLSLRRPLCIEQVGIVVKSAIRTTDVFILEGPSLGKIKKIGSSYLWSDPLGRYTTTGDQWAAYDLALREEKIRLAEEKKLATHKRKMLKTSSRF